MLLLSSIALVFALGISSVYGEGNVMELEAFNFDKWVANGKPAFVEFWAPWCDHCEQLKPIWEQLGDAFSHMKDKITIAQVNADAEGSADLLEKFNIKALPTLKFFNARGIQEDYDFEESRTLESLASFVTMKSGIRSKLPPPPPPPPSIVKQLNGNTFDKVANDADKDVLVAFTASWCGHCKNLKPIYNKVAWAFQRESNVVIAELDADTDPSRKIADRFNITGYPLIKLFPKGSGNRDKPIDFKRTRDEKSILDFVNEHAGTYRVIGGGLSEQAGRHEHMDKMAGFFVQSTSKEERERLYRQVTPVSKALGPQTKPYLTYMEKMLAGEGDDYLLQEGKRLVAMLMKKSLSDQKRDDIKIKANILASFVKAAVEKQEESAKGDQTKPKIRTKEEL